MQIELSTKFVMWLNKKFLEWQTLQGEPMDQQDFARYLGIKPTTYSSWINGTIDPSREKLKRVAAVLGFEIYEVLGLPRPDEREEVIAVLETLPKDDDEEINQLWDSIHRWLSDHGFVRTK